MLRLWRRFLGLNEPNFSSNGETPRNAPSPLTGLGLFDRKTSPTYQDPLSPHDEQQAAAWAEDRPHGSRHAAKQRVSNDSSPSGASPRPEKSAPKASRIDAVRYGMSYPCHTIGQTRPLTIALREVVSIKTAPWLIISLNKMIADLASSARPDDQFVALPVTLFLGIGFVGLLLINDEWLALHGSSLERTSAAINWIGALFPIVTILGAFVGYWGWSVSHNKTIDDSGLKDAPKAASGLFFCHSACLALALFDTIIAPLPPLLFKVAYVLGVSLLPIICWQMHTCDNYLEDKAAASLKAPIAG